ncbi:MAG: metallophosphoesterase [Tannerella sp.]|jgi:predicted MPP superfamily phosphohydrolase|nr:metallophosphoesterase [Tannerella sp.]
MRVFLHAIFGQLLFNSYVFWKGYRALPPKKKYRIPFTIVFALELSLYLIGFFFYKDIPDQFLLPILMICNTWYIAVIYVASGLIIIDFLRVTNRIRPWFPSFINNHPQKVKNIFFGIFLTGISILMIYGNYLVNNPVVKHVHIHIPKKAAGREKLTIAMMSDMHLGETIGKKHLQHYVKLCNEQQPDLIIIPGDVIDYESRFAEQMQMEKEFQQLKASLGVYITLGNHEYRANKNAKMRWFEKTGCIVLVDSVAMPDSGFYLIGRDDAINSERSSLHSLMGDLAPEKPLIVIDHRPDFINEIVMNKADLGLHGHTHNGQFWPNSLRLKLFSICSYGYYKKGNAQFYVSSGIGCAGPPFRVGTQSELVILHITFSEST